MAFIQSHAGTLGDIDGYIHLVPATYKSEKPKNVFGIDKVRVKCNYINGSIVNGCREPILYGVALDKPPGYKISK